MWCIQYVEHARDAQDAHQMLDALARQDGFLGGRVMPKSLVQENAQLRAEINKMKGAE